MDDLNYSHGSCCDLYARGSDGFITSSDFSPEPQGDYPTLSGTRTPTCPLLNPILFLFQLFFLWFSENGTPVYLVPQVRALKIILDFSLSFTYLFYQSPGPVALSPNHLSDLSPFPHPDKTLGQVTIISCPDYSNSLQVGSPASGLSIPPHHSFIHTISRLTFIFFTYISCFLTI